jgi:hypothetical protein
MMDFKQKRRLTKLLILLSILGISVITVLILLTHKKYNQSLKDFRPTSKLAYAKGITFTEYRGEKKVYSVSIDTISVDRVRVGPFAIGPLRVAQLSKVDVNLYLDAMETKKEKGGRIDKNGSEEESLDFESPISNIRKNLPVELRKIRGFKIKEISLNLWKNEDKIFRISSDTAEIDQKSRDLIFVGHAMIDSEGNGRLLSHRIRWNSKTHLFSADGLYRFTKSGENKEGTGIEVDYLFRRIHYQTSKE